MSTTTEIRPLRRLIFVVMLFAGVALGQERSAGSAAPPAWQNPDIGLTLDGVAELDDAEGPWRSPGVSIRGAELIISANIDPYASLLGNLLISEDGAELHEAFALFPYLPLNLAGKFGKMLADFGRWNRFHVHAMPFTSEPRMYKEYAGGMLALTGLEMSWLVPVNHYIEVTFSAYNRIQGHTHDSDPAVEVQVHGTKSADEIAEDLGLEKHGPHWHGPNGEILYEDDVLAMAEGEEEDPELITDDRRLPGFAYGGNIRTGIEFGDNFSLDLGASAIYQHEYKRSRRLEDFTYRKLLFDADAVLFWHPLTSNRYRNLQLGAEMLGSYEGFESLDDNVILEDYFTRLGVFNWLAWRVSQKWELGGFSEVFQANDGDAGLNKRFGAFLTRNITHYQYVRVEYSRWEYPGVLDGVNLIRLQYDATIGYHTHGRQR
jgi:hypothetical protein